MMTTITAHWHVRLSTSLFFALALFLPLHAFADATNAPPRSAVDLLKPSITQYKIDTWQPEQGLPQSTVQAMVQTRAGPLWVGTAGGLARFDGVRFVTFEALPLPDIVAKPIYGLMEDSKSSLWIGTGRGVARYRNGRFESAFETDITEGRRVWSFVEAPDGVIWMASENGLIRWEEGKGAAKANVKIFKEADGLPSKRLRSLAFDKAGTLWIGTTGGGLVSFSDGKFKVWNLSNGFPHLEVRTVLADPAGGIWAATAGAGLVHIDNGKIKTFTTADGLPTDQLTQIARDSGGALWIGTWGSGVVRMEAGRFAAMGTKGGLAGDQIWSLQIDREDTVWVGTWNGGLNRLRNRSFGVMGKPEGLLSDNVRSVVHARDGATWIATSGGGAHKYEAGLIMPIGKKEGLSTDESSALLEAGDGAIWIGSYTAGVSRFRQGKIDNFGKANGLPSLDTRALFQDRSGTVWAGTTLGLARFDDKAQTFTAVREAGAPTDMVSTILEDRAGTLWFGTNGAGLFRYRNGAFDKLTRKEGLVSNWVLALYEDAAGSLWIGTNGEGMNRYANGKLAAIRTTDGLWDGAVQVIIEDRAGKLWMTCNRGFFSVARAELDAFAEGRVTKINSTPYGPGDALRSTTFAGGMQPAGAIDAKGQLWLPSLMGLVIVDPTRLPGTGSPPTVAVEEVTVNGEISVPGVGTAREIVLPPGSVPLSIRYTAATLANADHVRFRYQLDGITHDWIDAGKNREASFPALPHGTYQFRVAASIDGKSWKEATEPLPITVKPYYYETRWFMGLAVFAAFAAIAGFLRLRTRKLKTHAAEMARLVAEKTDELNLANAHLSRLSYADPLTGLANRRRMDDTLIADWQRALREQTPLAVILADIDDFKAYNDSLGHPEGDKCLAAVAAVLRDATNRADDFVARYGGEEFIVILPGLDHAAALAYAEKIRKACEARAIPHPASRVASLVTLSLGVAVCVPTEAGSITALVAAADAALYQAKHEGRNRVR